MGRVVVRGNDIWLLEVKYKFPIDLPPKNNFPTLRFGINTGEIEVTNRLEQAGIRCLFTVLVKPVWSKTKLQSDFVQTCNAGKDGPNRVHMNRNVLTVLEKAAAPKGGSTYDNRWGFGSRIRKSASKEVLLVWEPWQLGVRDRGTATEHDVRPAMPPVKEDYLRGLRVTAKDA